MKMYKGFGPGMVCRGFQYEEGKTYETDEARLCQVGFHACENPIQCFEYYPPAPGVEYHEVDLDATDEFESGYVGSFPSSKRVGTRIKIGAPLSAADICNAHYAYVEKNGGAAFKGPVRAVMSAEDTCALQAGSGATLSGRIECSLMGKNCSSLSAQSSSVLKAGECSSLCAGDGSILEGEEHCVISASSRSHLMSGQYSVLATLDHSELTAGNMSVLAARTHSSIHAGDESIACALSRSDIAVGENSVAVCVNGKARAGLGSVIVFVNYTYSPYPNKSRIGAHGILVIDGGPHSKADTWYRMNKGGLIEEVERK